MTLPGTPSLALLFYLFAFLPWAALRSSRRLQGADGGAPGAEFPSRIRIWTGTLVMQGILLLLAWRVGSGFGFDIFAMHRPSLRDGLAALAALVACLVLRAAIRALRSEEERRSSMLYRIAPRTGRERTLRTATVLVASVAEEAAYRGVGFSILWYMLDDPWGPAIAMAIAFALAHRVQGWKAVGIIIAIALVMQGLVLATGTLVLAMAVHAAYDLIAGSRIDIEARQLDEAAAAG